MKRTLAESETLASPAAKKVKSIARDHGYAKQYDASFEPEVRSANDRIAGSIYKGRTLVDKTPQKIKFDNDIELAAQVQTQSKVLERKKSVTFTPETKIEDGATGQTFAKLWLLGTPPIQNQQQAHPDTPSSEQATPTKMPSQPPDEIKPQQKQAKKPKKPGQQPNDHDKRTACVQYLEQFHKDKSNWKFNKSRQNDILRHIWNTEQIPTTSDEALVAYVAGLQGAASQRRLIEGALILLVPLVDKHKEALGDLPVGSREERKQAFQQAAELETAARKDGEEAEADGPSLSAIARAKRLLIEALWQHLGSDTPGSSATTKPALVEPTLVTSAVDNLVQKRSRKSRTAALSDSDSSSSESDTDSDSESDSDAHDTSNTSDSDGSSSSSSSSSSSGSDSDSD